MVYVCLVFNIQTLCRILRYADEIWSREKTIIVYDGAINQNLYSLLERYTISFVSTNSDSIPRIFNNFYKNDEIHAFIVWKRIKSVLPKNREDLSVVVFKDNNLRDTTIIEKIKKKYGTRSHIYLMEEGTGLYASMISRNPARKQWLKILFCMLLGVSTYSLTHDKMAHGRHKAIEKIICSKPQLLCKRYENTNVVLEQQIEIYTTQFVNFLIQHMVKDNTSCTHYDFVFLTNPVDDLIQNGFTYDEYDTFLSKLFSILLNYGTVLVKKHPRDVYNYQSIKTREGITICSDEMNILPFECLEKYFGDPQILSLFSSVCMYICGNRPNIYLYKLLENSRFGGNITQKFLDDNNIIACESFSHLVILLNNQYNTRRLSHV